MPDIRPSNLFRYEKCPGWWRVPPAPSAGGDSPEAAEGRLLHQVMAALVEGRDDGPVPETDEQAANCAWALEQVADIIRRPDLVCTEQEMEWPALDMRGTADLVYLAGGDLHVVDWKFGRAEVDEAADNLQLAAYACMAALKWPGRNAVVAHVIQPRLGRHDEFRFGHVHLTVARTQILNLKARAEKPDAPLCPGDPQCNWCPGKANCPALATSAALATRTPETAILAATGPELAQYADIARLARKWADAIDAEAKRRLVAGEAVPGYGLQTRKTRKLEGIGEAFRRLGIPAPSFLECCSASLPKLEAAYKTEHETTAAQAKADVAAKLCDLIAEETTTAIKREAK